MSTKLKAQSLADMAASKVRIPSIPYLLGGRSNRGTDCINLVGWCVQEMGGLKSDVPSGSNTAWRSSMSWKGTMDEANKQGKLVPGALVYILRAPTEKWPDGDYGHVGIYTGERPEFKVYHVIVHASAVDGVTTCPMQTRWSRVATSNASTTQGSPAQITPRTFRLDRLSRCLHRPRLTIFRRRS